jgi:hypothetical protein
MKRLSPIALALTLVAAGCGSDDSTPTNPTPTNPTFTAALSPANEIPPIANAESTVSGTSSITLVVTRDAANNVTAATATFVVNLTNIPAGSTVNIAHIHECDRSCNGSIVVNTSLAAGEVTVTNGIASFTKANIAVDAAVAQRILNNPAGFYFNVHSTLNPGGFARGQLSRVS